jgi:hypothetical protein
MHLSFGSMMFCSWLNTVLYAVLILTEYFTVPLVTEHCAVLLLAEPFLLCCSWLTTAMLCCYWLNAQLLHLAENDPVLGEHRAVCAFLVFAEYGAVLF